MPPQEIDVFQLQPNASEEDILLCMNWIKAQIKARQAVTLLVKKTLRQELVPSITVDVVSKIQQKLAQVSADPRQSESELQELLEVYQKNGVKNQSLLIQIYIELAQCNNSEAQEKVIELMQKADEKVRKNYIAKFKPVLEEKIKTYTQDGDKEFQSQNFRDALACYQKAAELNEMQDDKVAGVRINAQIGHIYSSLKQIDDALSIWEKTIKTIQSYNLQAISQKELIFMLNNVGQIHFDKKSNKASQYWETAIQILESSSTQLDQQSKQLLGHLLNNVGMIYYQKGDSRKAIANFVKTIKYYEEIYGKNHISVGNRLNNLGEAYRQDKQYDKALENFNRALAIKKAEHKNVPTKSLASTIYNIAMTLQHKQSYDQAIKYFQEALAMYNEPGVYSDPNSGDAAFQKSNVLHSMGECYRALKNLEQANNHLREAYKLKLQELKIYHKSTQHTATQLASTLFQQAQYEESLQVFEEVLSGQQKMQGLDPQIVAQTIYNIGIVLQELKQYDKAQEKYKEAIKIFEMKLEKENPYLQRAQENLRNLQARLNGQ